MANESDLKSSLASLGIPASHHKIAVTNLLSANSTLQSLFIHKRLPNSGLSDHQIQHILLTLSSLDTNTSKKWVGVGEREGRTFSHLVQNRHFGFSHGVGRSGDLNESQPKAVGSTAMTRLANGLVLDAIRRGAGLEKPASNCNMLVPLCTGMSMALVLSSFERKVALWCRIDQKSCFKACFTAGMRVVIIPTRVEGDMVITDLDALREAVERENENELVIISTTSCFAPRVPDPVDEIAKIAEANGIPHIINHAYGLQCRDTNKLVTRACVVGRVDAIIMSMDKNFMVPVGGAVILSPNMSTIQSISKLYPGRASATPHLDLFITLLSMGLDGYKELLSDRYNLIPKFKSNLQQIAANFGERVLVTFPKNSISYAMTLETLFPRREGETNTDYNSRVRKDVSLIGSMLFTRCVSGTRVVPNGEKKMINGMEFLGFGSSTDNYTCGYLTMACSIGLTMQEMVYFFKRLEQVLKEYEKKKGKKDKRILEERAESTIKDLNNLALQK